MITLIKLAFTLLPILAFIDGLLIGYLIGSKDK